MNNPKKNNFRLLFWATFLHLFSLVCSAYGDVSRTPKGYHKFIEINYWLTFFGWWCSWASLITIIYFIYRLFKKSNHNYFDKIFDLIVINANIITISIFTISVIVGLLLGIKVLPLPRSGKIMKILSWEISSRSFWWFYSIIWHYLAPILTIVYFARRKISLAQTYFERRKLFLYSFFHPIIYFFYIFIRPSVPGADKYPFAENSKYPYFFFEWVMGEESFRHIIWGVTIIFIIFFWLIIFWSATLFFWWYSNHKIKKKKKINSQISPKQNKIRNI